ncbi:MAG: di-trans,poly-cis-decaprenylcistransferase [Bacteroidetes bacterium RIFOXYC12_FULL_35_7]|nr:MAG: di-trans,poly-cis-decaprenylcistransferase [Bacteroidetes bacterium RIFOXYC12_FULL_35_7]
MNYKEKIKKENLPSHVAIIMDGNGRWAKKKGNIRIFGHQNAVKCVRDIVEASVEVGIKYLTLYAFSTENWNRPKIEVNALMSLLVSTINSEMITLNENNVRLLAIGDLSSLPKNVRENLNEGIKKTSENSGLSLILALSYGSRWEITDAVRRISTDVKKGEIQPEAITEALISSYLSTSSVPDPELLIRTSGELRISNFLLWQIAYAELYFTDTLWPDFSKEEFFEAIYIFQNRERRFGKTSEQISKK